MGYFCLKNLTVLHFIKTDYLRATLVIILIAYKPSFFLCSIMNSATKEPHQIPDANVDVG